NQYASPTIPSRSTAALPPHPLPFFSCATGGCFPATFGFVGAAFAGALGGGGAEARFGAGGAGAGAAAFDGCGDIVSTSITRVPPPFAMLSPSSVGSNTSAISPNRTVAPGARGASPLI